MHKLRGEEIKLTGPSKLSDLELEASAKSAAIGEIRRPSTLIKTQFIASFTSQEQNQNEKPYPNLSPKEGFLLARSFNTSCGMEGRTRAGSTNNVQKEAVKEAADIPQRKEISVGDLLWVKIHGSSWWPSQVVDEKTVSDINKPSKKSSGDILVRLYGSYKYLYACKKCRAEFEKVLMEYNGNYDEIFNKALEEDLSRLKSGKSNQQGSKSKAAYGQGTTLKNNEGTRQRGSGKKLFGSGTTKRVSSRLSDAMTKPTEVKNSNLLPQKPEQVNTKKRKNGEEKNLEPDTPESDITSAGRSQDLSERNVKVMQNRGLTAPTGSPFCQTESISPSSIPS